MAHDIFGERFLGHRKPAWHGLGTVFENPLSATEAFTQAGLDFDYIEAPVYARLEGAMYEVPNRKAIMRTPTIDDPIHRVLSIVGDEFGVVQNNRIAEMLDPLTERWPVETVGALGKGERVFCTLAAGDSEVAGDEIKKFFLITDSKQATEALHVRFTPVRVVCQNTLMIALRPTSSRSNSEGIVVLPHTTHINRDLGWVSSIVMRMQAMADAGVDTLARMATRLLTDSDATSYIEMIWPIADKSKRHQLLDDAMRADASLRLTEANTLVEFADQWEEHEKRIVDIRAHAWGLYQRFGDEQPQAGNTAWALYNAAVELEDFRKGDAGRSAVFGRRAATKMKAFKLLSVV